jgi:hypothetical protein
MAFKASEIYELEPRSESFTRSLLEGMKGKGGKGANVIASFLFLRSFSGLHALLSQQGQRPKTVDAAILAKCSMHKVITSRYHNSKYE